MRHISADSLNCSALRSRFIARARSEIALGCSLEYILGFPDEIVSKFAELLSPLDGENNLFSILDLNSQLVKVLEISKVFGR